MARAYSTVVVLVKLIIEDSNLSSSICWLFLSLVSLSLSLFVTVHIPFVGFCWWCHLKYIEVVLPPSITIVFVRHTLGILAVAMTGDVIVGNSDVIGHSGKATTSWSSIWRVGVQAIASRSSIWRVDWALSTLSLLGCCSALWSGRSCYKR